MERLSSCARLKQAAPAHHENRMFQAFSAQNKNHPPIKFFLSIDGRLFG
jgi:hypothetical protein